MQARRWVCLSAIGAFLILGLIVRPARTLTSTAGLERGAPNPSLPASTYRTRNVFVVSIDGLRGSEAFDAPDPADFIPQMWNRLRPLGSLYVNFYNLGATWTTPGNHTIVDGCWEMTPNSGGLRYFRPACPTMFEYYRRANPQVPQNKVWAVVGKSNCDRSHYSWHPFYGEHYAASLGPSVQGSRSDEAVWSTMRRVMDDHHPSLVFLHLGEVDRAGHNNWGWYLDAIRDADGIVGELWDKIQSDPYYRDQTTMLVTTDHGRHDDEHGGFKAHGGICEGDKRLFLLALGPDIKQGQVFSEFRQQTDICPTVGELMGFDTPVAAGSVLSEMLVGDEGGSASVPSPLAQTLAGRDEVRVTHSPGIVEQPDIVVNAVGLHVVWVDDRGGNREIYHKLRYAVSSQWSDDLQLSFSGIEARAPSIAANGDTVHVVWQDYRSGNWAIYHRQRAADGHWSEPDLVAESVVEVAGDPGQRCEMTMEPALTVCQGQVLVAVPLMADRLRVFRRTAEGSWTPTTVVDAPASAHVPAYSRVLPQAVAFASGDGFCSLLWQEVLSLDWALKHTRGNNCGAVWEARNPPTYGSGSHDISAAAWGASVHAAWISSPYAVPPHALLHSRSAGESNPWSEPTVIRSDGCWHPDLSAASGMVALAWEDYRHGLPAIYLSRSVDDGASWDEQRVSDTDSFSIEPAVATDGQTAYAVWRDRRDGTWQLYLAQVSDVEPTPTGTATPTATPTETATATPTATETVTPPDVWQVYLPIVVKQY